MSQPHSIRMVLLDGDDKPELKNDATAFHSGRCITLRTWCAKQDQQDKKLEASISCAVRFFWINILFIWSPAENTISCCGCVCYLWNFSDPARAQAQMSFLWADKKVDMGGQEEEVRGEGKSFHYRQDS